MQKVTPFLWFDGKALEAARFYTSVFRNAEMVDTRYYGDAGPMPKGTVLTVTFSIAGQEFVALNGGPHYAFSPAVSFSISCETQDEIDELWEKLRSDGGKPIQCG